MLSRRTAIKGAIGAAAIALGVKPNGSIAVDNEPELRLTAPPRDSIYEAFLTPYIQKYSWVDEYGTRIAISKVESLRMSQDFLWSVYPYEERYGEGEYAPFHIGSSLTDHYVYTHDIDIVKWLKHQTENFVDVYNQMRLDGALFPTSDYNALSEEARGEYTHKYLKKFLKGHYPYRVQVVDATQ